MVTIQNNRFNTLSQMVSYLCERCERIWDSAGSKRLYAAYCEGLTAIALCLTTTDLYNAEQRILADMERLKHVRGYDWHMSKLLVEISAKQAEILKSIEQ